MPKEQAKYFSRVATEGNGGWTSSCGSSVPVGMALGMLVILLALAWLA